MPRKTASTSEMLERMSTEEIQKLIAEAAYYRAERRGFAPGGDVQDWLEAEAAMKMPRGPASQS